MFGFLFDELLYTPSIENIDRYAESTKTQKLKNSNLL